MEDPNRTAKSLACIVLIIIPIIGLVVWRCRKKQQNGHGQSNTHDQNTSGGELTRSLREPGGPCTKSMEISESRIERVNMLHVTLLHNLSIVLNSSRSFLQLKVEASEIWFWNYHSIFPLFSASYYDQQVVIWAQSVVLLMTFNCSIKIDCKFIYQSFYKIISRQEHNDRFQLEVE